MSILERLDTALGGRYRIERELGRGGMATVYLAEDVRHHRRVAVKVLHPELSAVIGSERFLKEIELTAGLQHPHILPLFDSGNADGLLYYVMPYVEGETLRGRLDKERQLPVADAVRIASEVASALEYAHGHQVIHRDIKPENILLQSGSALVADFGIALAVQSAGGERMTQTGLSLGTPHYMAPEQAMGERNIDHRADIYALGAVTYEMLAGVPPFSGPTAQSVIAKVMTEPAAPLSTQRKSVPRAVEVAVHRALEKLPADRWNTAQAFAGALVSTEAFPSLDTKVVRERRVARIVPWTVAAIGLALATWGWIRRPASDASLPPSRLSIVVPSGTSFPGTARLLDISADGSRIVYYSNAGNASVIQVQDLDDLAPRPIKGTEGAIDVHLSADGRTLFFGDVAETKMFRINVDGGAATPLEGVPGTAFAAFAPNGDFWASRVTIGRGILHVSASGKAIDRFLGDTFPKPMVIQQVLPNGRHALVKELQNNDGLLYVMDLQTGKVGAALFDFPVAEARYAVGYLVFVKNDGRLNAASFDVAKQAVTGVAVQLAEDVSLSGNGIAQFAVAQTGTIVYTPAQPRELVLVDRSGKAEPLTAEKHNYHQPRFSPDGRSIAVDFPAVDGRDVWKLDRNDGSLSRVTTAHDGHDPSWAADGRSLLYASSSKGVYAVFRTRPGSGTSELLASSDKLGWPGRWMPGGKTILSIATDMKPGSGGDIITIDSAGRLHELIATKATEQSTDISPDGKWLAFTSDLAGQNEVFLRSLATDADQIQVSLSGGVDPMWSRDGKELFYRATNRDHTTLMTASIQTSPSLSVASRKVLFAVDEYDGAQPHSNYDVSPDAQHFVMVRRGDVGRLVVLQNLPALVKKLQGSRK